MVDALPASNTFEHLFFRFTWDHNWKLRFHLLTVEIPTAGPLEQAQEGKHAHSTSHCGCMTLDVSDFIEVSLSLSLFIAR